MNTSEANARMQFLIDGQVLVGKVHRPFVDQDKLRGAILSFDDTSETALLHIKQIKGESPEERLSQLRLGDEIEVKIIIHGPAHARKVWASETALVSERTLVEELSSAAEAKTVFRGRVDNVSKFGVFVDLLEGVAKGQRGLIHNSNLYQKGAGLAQVCHSLTPNSEVSLQVLGAKVDTAGTLRIDLVLAQQNA